MSGKKKHKGANDYLQYLKGEISNQERHAFEKGLEADPFDQEALEGLETLDSRLAEQDMLYLHNRLRKRLSRRRRVAFYSVAATVASLLIVGTVFLKVHDFNPRPTEKKVYQEEAYDSDHTHETETPVPAQKEKDISESASPARKDKEISEPVSPSRNVKEISESASTDPDEKGVAPRSAPLKRSEPAKDRSKAQTKSDPDLKVAELQEEQITHMEAAPLERAEEKIAAPATQKSAMRKKSMSRPAAQSAQEVSSAMVTETELAKMPSGRASGIVISSEDKGPIYGAKVENRAGNYGVFTNVEGRFDIPVREDTPTTLVVNYIGMKTQEVRISDGTRVKLIMQPDAATLDELVLISYGAQGDKFPSGSAFTVHQSDEGEGDEYSVPEPAIGSEMYKQYVEKNMEFPPEHKDINRAIVVLMFRVTHKGAIEEIVALKSPGEAFTSEATRLLMEGPPWNPATNDRGTRDELVYLRIVFKK